MSTHVSLVVSLAALQGYCYWLDERTGVERVTITGDGRRAELQHRGLQITDIAAVSMPDMKIIRNHTCSSGRAKCSHFCIAEYSDAELCSCPDGQMLLVDNRSCGALPACGPSRFTCAAHVYGDESSGSDLNKVCIPIEWRCDGTNGKYFFNLARDTRYHLHFLHLDCSDKSDEVGCASCKPEQFRCRSGECIENSLLCDGTTHVSH